MRELLQGIKGDMASCSCQYFLFGGATLLVGGFLHWLLSRYSLYQARRNLTTLRTSYQTYLKNQKLKFKQYLDTHPLDAGTISKITSMPVMELLQGLRSKSMDHEQVLLAYQHKAYEVNERLNCVTEFLFPDLSQTRLDGPLAGLPVSIKENFHMKNMMSCAGLSEFFTKPLPTEDALLVKMLKDLGAVPFCRTNIPQAMLSLQSANPVYGTTCNPHDPTRSPGGSSSGEGALISAGGSPLGFGTDIGGSIRVPAAWSGIVGFKPTAGRISTEGLMPAIQQKLIPESCGPLARDVDSINEIMRLLADSEVLRNRDCYALPLSWRQQVSEGRGHRRLRIGYFTFNGYFQTSPALERVVEEVKESLIKRGHELVPFELPGGAQVYFEYVIKFLLCDGSIQLADWLKLDEVDESLRDLVRVTTLPKCMLPLVSLFYRFVLGDADATLLLGHVHGYPNVDAMWRDFSKFEGLRREFEKSYRAVGLDALLCPSVGCLPALLRHSGPYLGAVSYTTTFNVLNCPAGVVPVRKVRRGDLGLHSDKRIRSCWHDVARKFDEKSEGLPLSVQVVTLPFHDEECIHVMKEVEEAVKEITKDEDHCL